MNFEDSNSAFKEITNKNYEFDINYVLRSTRWFLTIIGIWPRIISNPTRIERQISKLLFPLSTFFMFLLIIQLTKFVIVRELKGSQLLIIIGPIGFAFGCVLKHVVLLLQSSSIKMCMKHMECDWRRIDNERDREIMLKNLKIGHDMTILAAVCLYSSVAFHHIVVPLCRGKRINSLNETVKPLPYPGADLFIDPRIGYNYEIIYCAICMSTFVRYTVIIGSCNLVAIFVTHACGQIEMVMLKLENLLRADDEKVIDTFVVAKRIAFITRHHVRAIKFSLQIDEVLRGLCLVEVIFSTFVICLIEYYCVMEWKNSDTLAIITFTNLLASLSFNMYIYCYIGALLKDQFHQVGDVAYNIEWYRLPGNSGLDLIMIISMSNYPVTLSAGKMMELSFDTFGNIMKTTLGYLNMLRSVTN